VTTSQATRLKTLLERKAPVLAPGACDGLSARMIEAAGFEAIYLGGGAMARAAGYADVGLLQLSEVAERIDKILDVTELPLIVDADTGYGGLPNLRRTARCFARMGIAAFHIEDQVFPKRCGLLAGKEVVPLNEMVIKLDIARQALGASDTMLIARCDALSVEGFDRMLERACAYRAGGADMLFIEGLSSREQLQAVAHAVDGQKMLDLYPGPESPLPRALSTDTQLLASLGFALLIFPSDLQRAAIRGMQRVLETLLRDGSTAALADELVDMRTRDALVCTQDSLDLGSGKDTIRSQGKH
jgi:2-methylisocitrate lyase-like PEP mutase family enzyme